MGWASGSGLADKLWTAVRPHIPEESRMAVARAFVMAFESQDCDTMEECSAEIGDAANMLWLERNGAPLTPAPGQEYTDKWDTTYRFDGRCWRVVE